MRSERKGRTKANFSVFLSELVNDGASGPVWKVGKTRALLGQTSLLLRMSGFSVVIEIIEAG